MHATFKKRLLNNFKNKKIITKKDIRNLYLEENKDINSSTLNWRISYLVKQNILQPVGKNLYTLSIKPTFKALLSKEGEAVIKTFLHSFDDVLHCIWETSWLNDLMQHQMTNNLIILEIENDILEFAFYRLKEKFKHRVFLNPDKEVVQFYVMETEYPIIIKRLITRSPLNNNRFNGMGKYYTPRLEKILVDIFADDNLFFMLDGREIEYIFSSALENYAINFTKMFDYAKRRTAHNKLKMFLNNNFGEQLKGLI